MAQEIPEAIQGTLSYGSGGAAVGISLSDLLNNAQDWTIFALGVSILAVRLLHDIYRFRKDIKKSR